MGNARIRSLLIGLSVIFLVACGSPGSAEGDSHEVAVTEQDQANHSTSNSHKDDPSGELTSEHDLNTQPVDPKTPSREPVEWVGTYFFDNDGGKDGRMMLGNELELEIKEGGFSDLGIFSKSMATPHAKLKVTAEKGETECRIIHSEYVKGTGWKDLEAGTELFSLRMEGGVLITTWAGWKPLYGDLPAEGKYFEKQ